MLYVDIERKTTEEVINLDQIMSIAKKDNVGLYSIVFATCTGHAFTRVYETIEDRDRVFKKLKSCMPPYPGYMFGIDLSPTDYTEK